AHDEGLDSGGGQGRKLGDRRLVVEAGLGAIGDERGAAEVRGAGAGVVAVHVYRARFLVAGERTVTVRAAVGREEHVLVAGDVLAAARREVIGCCFQGGGGGRSSCGRGGEFRKNGGHRHGARSDLDEDRVLAGRHVPAFT